MSVYQAEFVTTEWRKSRRCEAQHCVEVAKWSGGMAVRNSTVPDSRLAFDAPAWAGFISRVRTGEFDAV
jgi:hypothetical protein